MNNPKRILIIRLSAIGDIVFSTPFVRALKQHWPDSEIHWLCGNAVKSIIDANPHVSHTIPLPLDEWRKLWRNKQLFALIRDVRRVRRLLREQNYDMAIDLQGLLKSGLWAWFSNASRRIGLGSREGSQYLMNEVYERGGDISRISSEYIHLAEQLGFENVSMEMELAIDETSQHNAHTLIRDTLDDQPFAVILPFTTRAQKHWFDASWITLVQRLQQQDYKVVMLGGPADSEHAELIASQAHGLVNWVGKTRLLEAAAIIQQAQCSIGVDTGLTHMSIALNRPTIALFGSTCPYTQTGHDNVRVLYHKLSCSPCKRHPVCHGRFDCMQAIQCDEIMQALSDITRKAAA